MALYDAQYRGWNSLFLYKGSIMCPNWDRLLEFDPYYEYVLTLSLREPLSSYRNLIPISELADSLQIMLLIFLTYMFLFCECSFNYLCKICN